MYKPTSVLIVTLALLGLPAVGHSSETAEIVLVANRVPDGNPSGLAAESSASRFEAPLLVLETRRMQKALAQKIDRQVKESLEGGAER